jgi:hypothetical protein
VDNLYFLNEQNETVYKKFTNFEHEHLHKLEHFYSDTINPILAIEDFSAQLDAYLKQNLVCCRFDFEATEEKTLKELIEENYTHEEFVLEFIRTAYRIVNRESKRYDSMLDDDLHEFDEDDYK